MKQNAQDHIIILKRRVTNKGVNMQKIKKEIKLR